MFREKHTTTYGLKKVKIYSTTSTNQRKIEEGIHNEVKNYTKIRVECQE
jgi:hypothetical protein